VHGHNNTTIGFIIVDNVEPRKLLTPELNDYVFIDALPSEFRFKAIRADDFTPTTISNLHALIGHENAREFVSNIPCESLIACVNIGATPDQVDHRLFTAMHLSGLLSFVVLSDVFKSKEYHAIINDIVLACMRSETCKPFSRTMERSFCIDAILKAQEEERYVIFMLIHAREKGHGGFRTFPVYILRHMLVPMLTCTLNFKFGLRALWNNRKQNMLKTGFDFSR
jgi:hypothetical protein